MEGGDDERVQKSALGAWLGGRLWVRLFFFSSRRRHTRFDCDWSSDVCSSDLIRINLNAKLFVLAFQSIFAPLRRLFELRKKRADMEEAVGLHRLPVAGGRIFIDRKSVV